jgi:hypothetical protein
MGSDRVQNERHERQAPPEGIRVADAAGDRMQHDVQQERASAGPSRGNEKNSEETAKLVAQGKLHDVQLTDEQGAKKESRFRGLSAPAPDGKEPSVSGAPSDSTPKGDAKPGANDGTADGGANENRGNANGGRDEAPVTEVYRSPNFDAKKPTAAFLDGFKDAGSPIGNWSSVQHGDLSMGPAQKNGYNTIGLQAGDKQEINNTTDFSKPINAIADQVESGKLPLGKGDVLNVSMGNKDPSFQKASEFLGFNVNAQNLDSEKDHILSRMGEIANDPSRSEADRFTAGEVVRTNQAIDRLQKQGVEVVHSAGNNGPDKFSWDFLNAKTDLGSTKPSGKSDDYATSNSLTKPADGILPVTHDANLRPLDSTPVEKQGGSFTVGGVSYPADAKDTFTGNTQVFDRDKVRAGASDPMIKPEAPALSASDLSPNLTYKSGEPAGANTGVNAGPPSDRFSGQAAPPGTPVVKVQPYGKDSPFNYQTLQPGEQAVADKLVGTSFSNIDYLKKNYDRLFKLKNE